MATDPFPIGQDMLRQALNHLESALDLLDQADVSAHIGARLDLVICDLQSAMGIAQPFPDQDAAAARPS